MHLLPHSFTSQEHSGELFYFYELWEAQKFQLKNKIGRDEKAVKRSEEIELFTFVVE